MNIIKLQGETEKRYGIYYEYDVDTPPLGEGGMGRVFKGFRVVERTGERMPVAIKAIYENIPERVVERARREAAIQLENDNLIRMYGFVETEDVVDGVKGKKHYHVIMELLVGVTLEDLMNGITYDHTGLQIPFASELYGQFLNQREAAVIRIMKPILSGVMALHDRGYIHRDIDPSNVMITIDKKIKLIDFGICKQIISLESQDKALTASGVFMGKVNYAAPELVLGDVKSQNFTTDIYAIGVLLYQLYTGHLPFSGTDQDILKANLHKKLPMKDVRSSEFRHIINKATDKVQSKRYASVAELRVDLEHISMSGNRIGTNRQLKIIVGVACGIVVLAIVGYFLLKPSPVYQEPAALAIKPSPTIEELYREAKALLNRRDSMSLVQRGKEKLRILVEDSLYEPAMTDYYVLLIRSSSPREIKAGYEGLQRLSQDSLNAVAMFECGLTLSKSNRYFPLPAVRQKALRLEADLKAANRLLYKAMEIDTTDYRSVYWAFNNLMEQKIAGTLSLDGDAKLLDLYRQFGQRAEMATDQEVQAYKEAIKNDGETLRAWGILR